MTVKTAGPRDAEYLISEANGRRSRDRIILSTAARVEPGTVLGRLANGKYVVFDEDASTGAEEAHGILYAGAGAAAESAVDVDAVAHVRDCEIQSAALIWPESAEAGDKTAALAELKALGIIAR